MSFKIYIYCVLSNISSVLSVCLSFIYVPFQIYGDFTITGKGLQNVVLSPAPSVLG